MWNNSFIYVYTYTCSIYVRFAYKKLVYSFMNYVGNAHITIYVNTLTELKENIVLHILNYHHKNRPQKFFTFKNMQKQSYPR